MITDTNEPIEWRSCINWPEYEVSNTGAVRSWIGPGFAKKHKRTIPAPKKQCLGRDGYLRVTFSRNSKSPDRKIETFSVHRLVAMCFLDGDFSLDVAHLDGDKQNNNVNNLQFVTKKVNESHKLIHETRARGSRNGQSKLCEKSILAIRNLHKEHKWTQIKIAKLFSITQSNVSAILLEKSWFHL